MMSSVSRILRTSLLCLFVFVSFHLYGQNGYSEGYIITNDNDTLSGFIKDRKKGTYEKLYKKIRFKGNNLFIKRISPRRIKTYYVDGSTFESVWLQQKGILFKESYISEPNRGEKVFLKLVQDGYLKLYHLEYTDDESSYVDYIELFKREDENYLIRATQGIFGLKKKVLSEYFQDCQELVEKINSKEIKYAFDAIQFYNECKGNETGKN